MKKVFLSSVVNGFTAYREAAKKGVTLTLNHPVMCEDFGARHYNSETTCISEVQNCDIYILILGEKYGWIPPYGTVSVTHREYLTARETNKKILVFTENTQNMGCGTGWHILL